MEWSVATVLIVFMLCRVACLAIDRWKPDGDSTTEAIGFHHDLITRDTED